MQKWRSQGWKLMRWQALEPEQGQELGHEESLLSSRWGHKLCCQGSLYLLAPAVLCLRRLLAKARV